MNEILLDIISVICTAIILPLLYMGGNLLIRFVNEKIEIGQCSKFVEEATKIVLNTVRCISQTYVDALKKEGKFDVESQKTALKKAKEMILSQMQNDVKDCIEKTYGDLDIWLTTQIEASVNLIKKEK